MDGMADYIRAPSRMFPDVSDFEAAAGFLNSEKMRSLGLHHPPPSPFGPHQHNPRLPPMATIQQHLLAIQQRTYPGVMSSPSAGPSPNNNNNNNQLLPIPFPHHLLSQWTLAAAAGFGLNQLGLFGLGSLPGAGLAAGLQQQQQTSGTNPSASPPQSSPTTVAHLPAAETTAAVHVKGQHSPPLPHRHHRFSPYPMGHTNKMLNHSTEEPSERSPASSSASKHLTFDK